MNRRFKLRNGIVLFSFNDNSGSVFYDDNSGDILSLPIVSNSEEENLIISQYHEVSIERLSKRGWIIIEDA